MNIDLLQYLLDLNVVKLSFVKKTGELRQMTCTCNKDLLESPEGIYYLKYKPTNKKAPYKAKENGNVIVWDIIKRDYRQIPAKDVQIKEVIPADEYKNMLSY